MQYYNWNRLLKSNGNFKTPQLLYCEFLSFKNRLQQGMFKNIHVL